MRRAPAAGLAAAAGGGGGRQGGGRAAQTPQRQAAAAEQAAQMKAWRQSVSMDRERVRKRCGSSSTTPA